MGRERGEWGERESERARARAGAYALRGREGVKFRGSLGRVLVRFSFTIIPGTK